MDGVMAEDRPRFHGNDIRLVKRSLRKKFREIRMRLDPQEKAEWDQRITANLLRSPRYRNAKRVLLFVSKPIEVDTHSFIRTALRQKKQVLLPRCLDDCGHMAFYAIQSWEDLVPGLYGLLEPDPERCPCIEAFHPTDFCLVPGFSFDAQGYRLGFGKGYYDRFLSRFPGVTAGACYHCCTTQSLPHGRYDRPVDYLFTERYVRRLAPSDAALPKKKEM